MQLIHSKIIFIGNILKESKLDLFLFVTLASLLQQAALKATKIEYELLTDFNMKIFLWKRH